MEDKRYYRVVSTLDHAPLRDYLLHGYETRRDFEQALHRLVSRWHGRTGESIDERHGFLRLRFYDTPGGKPDEEWLPLYLLQPVAMSDSEQESSDDSGELDIIFGFD